VAVLRTDNCLGFLHSLNLHLLAVPLNVVTQSQRYNTGKSQLREMTPISKIRKRFRTSKTSVNPFSHMTAHFSKTRRDRLRCLVIEYAAEFGFPHSLQVAIGIPKTCRDDAFFSYQQAASAIHITNVSTMGFVTSGGGKSPPL